MPGCSSACSLLGAAILLSVAGGPTPSGRLATVLSWASFVVALPLLFSDVDRLRGPRRRALSSRGSQRSFQLDAGLLLDPLSISFVLLITFVGSSSTCILGYMKEDPTSAFR